MSDLVRRDTAPAVRWREDGRPAPESLIAAGPGTVWWEDTKGNLAQRLRVGKERGEIVLLAPPGPVALRRQGFPVYGALVRQLKPRPPRWRKPLIITGVILAVFAGLLWAIYAAIKAIFGLAAAVAPTLGGAVVVIILLAVAWSLLRGHPCSGIHCSGCKG